MLHLSASVKQNAEKGAECKSVNKIRQEEKRWQAEN